MREMNMKGISTCNPVDFDKEYLLYTARYAIEHKFNHYQFIGPIHNPEKGNIDGMIFYRKYAQFNGVKNAEYVNYALECANQVCDELQKAGVKSYMWHHELELPEGFEEAYPEILNSYGDVEITHPLVKDFLENKIEDFFYACPKMDGIILTLHETRIPLLKLKNQKLDKIERVKYVTEILFKACEKLGKELIVRPFASLEEDYAMMTKAYEQISTKLVIMDKWIQFDWSLTLPENAFFNKIKNNPLLVETDIFGEYFGKGFLPIMLKEHIQQKFSYCEKFAPIGYVSRIDRGGYIPFGTVQEVNLRIMEACLQGEDVEKKIDDFFAERYGKAGGDVRKLMENTEDIQKGILYLNGYYYSELSRFPRINHCKNHFYFEMMKEDYEIASNEWFIPKNWKRGELSKALEEKQTAVKQTEEKLCILNALKGKISDSDYEDLNKKFWNLHLVAKLWLALTEAFIAYMQTDENALETALQKLLDVNAVGTEKLGKAFYVLAFGDGGDVSGTAKGGVIGFVNDMRMSFALERKETAELEKENLTDYIICGGGNESHKLQKEVNFSDTYIYEDGLCRIPGTNRGKAFSTVNAHGWFSYEIKVKPNTVNEIVVVAKGSDGCLDFSVEIDGKTTVVKQKTNELTEIPVSFTEENGKDKVRIRIDRITGNTPYIYQIKVKGSVTSLG